ncbi:hypothetical protein SK069_06415 [Patulibacter brassicae]|uniref:Uncharacterized protein n=1 Tax=Patulibacter brassicae TaxID=1705717 RepID=A0ABU4VJV3_9ACTN|nr:hypothetical protein [Patulibacter brassicae]MDX8151216.1 hypothetical protein [Patulibacter brassicae]
MQQEHEQEGTRGRRGLAATWRGGRGRTRAVLLGTGVLVVGLAPIGYAATGGNLLLGERNGADDETSIVATENAGPGRTGGYATRQSNLSTTGGGAIYGCRSSARTQPTDERNPCLRANNLSNGLSFEFRATKGSLGGTISVNQGGDGVRPFTTNATGVATGLNADRVDGKDADALIREAVDQAVAAALQKTQKVRWLVVNAAGEIEAQSGGFTMKSAYVGNPAGASENVYVDAGEDLSGKAITATLGLQNQTDQNGDGVMNGKAAGPDSNPEFSGEIAATRCAIAGVVACAPTGTNTSSHFVVSPRMSDGSPTSSTTRKRFTITISG